MFGVNKRLDRIEKKLHQVEVNQSIPWGTFKTYVPLFGEIEANRQFEVRDVVLALLKELNWEPTMIQSHVELKHHEDD